MKSFLYEVAEDLYNHYGSEMGEVKMLFPSRRARIFFTDILSSITTAPLWEPEWLSMDSMMSGISGIEVGERVRLVAELYKIYSEFHPTEQFDHFYGWGEILLADFDMVDKYMIDADQLFRNISDIKEIESDLSFMSERELRIIAFWRSVGSADELSNLKRSFLKVWRSLATIYHRYRERLLELGFAYSGMVHRIAAERIKDGEYSFGADEVYVVAGFNALSECEKILLKALKSQTQCRFYWDWDNYYAQNPQQEAGLFIRDNLTLFPSAADITHDNLSRERDVTVVSSSSSALQCRYVSQILDQIVKLEGAGVDKRTAIVLTDESLLTPLLHSLPPSVGGVNVTMGYPIRQSLAYSFVERLIALQSHSRRNASGVESLYHVDVVGLLSHPYLEIGVGSRRLRALERMVQEERLISVPVSKLVDGQGELLTMIFRRVDGWSSISKYIIEVLRTVASIASGEGGDGDDGGEREEFLGFIEENITLLHNVLESCSIELTPSIYYSLLRRHLQSLRIPYEGEPLEGLQVMGILETRNLDFDNVILLSMNDDNFPGNRVQQPSYIPYNLRMAFEMPTPEHHDGVYAYYFYRLIQRTKRVWMLYCSAADDKSTGEQSRYITQLDYESPFNLRRIDVGVDVNLFEPTAIEIEKSGRVREQLMQFVMQDGVESKQLSPTALFQYVVCPLRFYFRSLARISVSEELSEEVDAPMFGTILHNAMQELYAGDAFGQEGGVREAIAKITDRDIERVVEQAIGDNYLKGGGEGSQSKIELSGNLMIVREVITKYIKGGILRYDTENPNFRVEGNEVDKRVDIELKDGRSVRIRGVCDRVDRLQDGSVRIVDYKTGADHLAFDGVQSLFEGEGRVRQGNIFQILLYSYMLLMEQSQRGSCRIIPALYYVRKMNLEDYSPNLICVEGEGRAKVRTPIESYAEYREEFEAMLHNLLEELFDMSTPFRQCEDREGSCTYCDYSSICSL